MSDRPQHSCLTDALAAAQAEFAPIVKDKTAKVRSKKTDSQGKAIEFTYQYSDLADVIEAVTPALCKHGLAQVQRFKINGQHQTLLTELRFKDEALESEIILPIANCDPQECGKIITYFRRYALQALLGITAERDDDAADTKHVKQPAPQAQRQQQPTRPTEIPKATADGRGWSLMLPWGEVEGPFAHPTDACRRLYQHIKGSEEADGMTAEEARTFVATHEPLINAAPPEAAAAIVKLVAQLGGSASPDAEGRA